jgi:hypothetical protein
MVTDKTDDLDPLGGQMPDYAACSLDELYDVRQRLDAGRFPQRSQALDREIARRQSLPEFQRAARKPPPIRYFRRTVATAMILGGAVAVISVLSASWTIWATPDLPLGRTARVLVELLIMLTLFGLTVYAGRELFRGRRAGFILTYVVLGLQIVSFRVFGFEYAAALPVSIYFYLPSGQLMFNFGMHWSLGLGSATDPGFVGFNLVALSMLGLVLEPAQLH